MKVTAQLAEFVLDWVSHGPPPEAIHDGKRVLLNGLGATLDGCNQPVIAALETWARGISSTDRQATTLWNATRTASEYAAMVDAAQWTVLLADARHVGTGQHPIGPAAAAALAEGERLGVSGRQFLTAMTLAVEVELAFLMSMMPSIRDRRLICISMAGALAGAVAAGILNQLNHEQMTNAIGIGVMTNIGLWEMGGTATAYYDVGMSALAGVNACHAARLGIDAPASAYEGEYGALHAYSDETEGKALQILGQLGSTWRIGELMMQRHSGDTVTQAPLDCLLDVRQHTPEGKRRTVERMVFSVDPRAAAMVNSRTLKFGRAKTELEANSDPRHALASAWLAGRFTNAQKSEAWRERFLR